MFIRMNELASAICSSADAHAPAYSSTLRIGFENERTLKDVRVEKLDRR
jgi:hypothetical protein